MTGLFEWLSVDGLPVWLQLICFFAAGGAGGLLRHLVSEGGLILWSVEKVSGKRLLRLGFLTHMCTGALIGAAVDGNVATAFGYGIAAPYIAEKIIQRRLNGKRRK